MSDRRRNIKTKSTGTTNHREIAKTHDTGSMCTSKSKTKSTNNSTMNRKRKFIRHVSRTGRRRDNHDNSTYANIDIRTYGSIDGRADANTE